MGKGIRARLRVPEKDQQEDNKHERKHKKQKQEENRCVPRGMLRSRHWRGPAWMRSHPMRRAG